MSIATTLSNIGSDLKKALLTATHMQFIAY
jgi:hypothetical protein